MSKVIVTGGLGFIGSHLIKELLRRNEKFDIVNADTCSYAAVHGYRFQNWPAAIRYSSLLDARAANLGDHHRWVGVDISWRESMEKIFHYHEPDIIINLAAESHVDRSIDDSGVFIDTNIKGTHVLLECCREQAPEAIFIQVSTDEVYGAYPTPSRVSGVGYTEDDMLDPGNPYSASKAAAEHLAMAYANTYGLDVRITRGCNTYGPYQYPEKFLPLFILNALEGKPLPVYGDGRQVREWLHVMDHVDAILYVVTHGEAMETYNITRSERWSNLEVAKEICRLVGCSEDLIEHVEDRPGHDPCYANVATRLCNVWEPRCVPFMDGSDDSGLARLVSWFRSVEGQQWCAAAGHNARVRRGLGSYRKEEEADES